MLRRDIQYVLTWDALEYCWLAHPVSGALDGDLIGRGATRVTVLDVYESTLMETGDQP